MINELAELVEMYEQGAWSRGDYFHRITLLVPDFSIEDLIHELPTSDRDDFVCWLRETYDNDVPPDGFVSIGAEAILRWYARESIASGAGCARIVESMSRRDKVLEHVVGER